MKTYRFRRFYVVQHKDGDIADELGELAVGLGYLPCTLVSVALLMGVVLGIALASVAMSLDKSQKDLQVSLFSAQAEIVSLNLKEAKK